MIAPDVIARLKERTDIVALIGETVRLVRRGKSFTGLCPFHKEKSPSFHVHQERGFFHCFGCQESGSAIDFVMKTNGLEFLEAVRYLADRAGIVIEQTAAERSGPAKSERDELYGVMQLAATYYMRCLGLSSEGPTPAHAFAHYAVAELQKRGMPAAAVGPSPQGAGEEAERWSAALAAFRIGYAPPGWDGLALFLRQQGVSVMLAERAGLLVPGQRGHYDRFRHRLMFAVLDPLGRVIAFSGRALAPPSKEDIASHGRDLPSYDGDPAAKYINSPESPIYHKGEQLFGLFQAKQGMRRHGYSVLVEGNFDVASLHAAGIDNVVAPLGTAFTTEQAKLLKRFAPVTVVLFDGDAAGKKATRAARVPCREGGLDAKVATLPDGKDPDDLVRTEGRAALEARIKGARGMLEHLILEALEPDRFEGASVTERLARVRQVTKLLAEEPDPNLRAMAKSFADQLSPKLIVANAPAQDLLQLERMVAAAMRPEGGVQGARAAAEDVPHTPAQKFALAIFGVLLDFPELLADPDIQPGLDLLEGDFALGVVALRRTFASGRPRPDGSAGETSVDLADFLATLPQPIQSFSAGRLASPGFEDVSLAKAQLLGNTDKLRKAQETRQKSVGIKVLERSTSSFDAEGEALLREMERQARRRQGLDE